MKCYSKFYFIIGALFFCLFTVATQAQTTPKKKTVSTIYKPAKKIVYRYRKYEHVKTLYSRLALPVTELCIKHKVPPGAILSILSLESGWGQGYIGRITGNFLSLNAVGSNPELPALKMPKHTKTGKVILDKRKLSKLPKDEIVWQNRPESLKKDYRPTGIAGTKTNLDYFILHPQELTQANLENVSDFVSRFISLNSSIKAYREARKFLDKQIEIHGTNILFDQELNKQFINMIGGRPNTFNFRPTWPKKAINILKNVGANQLVKDLYINKKSFNEAW